MSDKEQPNPSPTESIEIIRHQKAERNRAELARKKNALLILDILAGQDLSYSECEATLNTALSALKHYSVLPLISSKKLHDSFSHKHNAEGRKTQ